VRTLFSILGIALGVWVVVVGVLLLMGHRTAAGQLVGLIPNLLRLFRGLLRDPRVPRRSKLLLALGVVWIASPIDLIPEFIPILGPLDDALIAALILRHILRKAGSAVVREHWPGDQATIERMARVLGMPAEVS
jgi:uncharacterized membrane protein YkvA (DUF1232 family)